MTHKSVVIILAQKSDSNSNMGIISTWFQQTETVNINFEKKCKFFCTLFWTFYHYIASQNLYLKSLKSKKILDDHIRSSKKS